MYLKYILLIIISSITNILPISYSAHIYLYQNLFNTKIFNDKNLIPFFYLPFVISIIYINKKKIIKFFIQTIKRLLKKEKKKFNIKINNLKKLILSTILTTLIYFLTPKLKLNLKTLPIYFFITAIIILLSNNKKGEKKETEINIKEFIFFSFSQLLTFIPTISPLCSNLLISKKLKLNHKTSLKYSFITIIPIYTLKSFHSIIYIYYNQEYLLFYSISIIISTIISINIFNYFYSLYTKNKLYKLSIYCILVSLFILYWYR